MKKYPLDKHHFHFKKFSIKQDLSPMKVNTDAVLLGAWSKVDSATRVLDIGTGTGIIALMLAQKKPSLMIEAIDNNEAAYFQALENFQNTPLGLNILCIHKSFQDFQKDSIIQYDLIITNPPFFTTGTPSVQASKASVRHTIELSFADIIQGTKKLLSSDGFLDLILPNAEGQQFKQMAMEAGFFIHSTVEVLSKWNKPTERLLMRFSKKPVSKPDYTKLVIMNGNSNDYSLEYCQLTRDFYLFM